MPARSARQRSLGVLLAVALVLVLGWRATREAASLPSPTPSPAPPAAHPPPHPEPAPDRPTLADGPRLATPTSEAPRSDPPAPPPSSSRAGAPSATVPLTADAPCSSPAIQGVRVAFVESSASVNAQGRTTLQTVAHHMLRCPDSVLRIDARATQKATPEDNLVLSRLRSQAVANHLTDLGVAVHRLVSTYRGDRDPRGDHAGLTLYPGGSP